MEKERRREEIVREKERDHTHQLKTISGTLTQQHASQIAAHSEELK